MTVVNFNCGQEVVGLHGTLLRNIYSSDISRDSWHIAAKLVKSQSDNTG